MIRLNIIYYRFHTLPVWGLPYGYINLTLFPLIFGIRSNVYKLYRHICRYLRLPTGCQRPVTEGGWWNGGIELKKNKNTLSVKRYYKIICLIFFFLYTWVFRREVFFRFYFHWNTFSPARRTFDTLYPDASNTYTYTTYVYTYIYVCEYIFFHLSRLRLYYVIIIRTLDGGVNAYLNGRVRRAGYKFNRSSARRGRVYRIPIE